MTDTNDIVERLHELSKWLLGSNTAFLLGKSRTCNEAIDLIQKQAKDITAMVKQIALQETRINELEAFREFANTEDRKLRTKINELEALLYRIVNDLEYKCDIDGLRAFIIAALKEDAHD